MIENGTKRENLVIEFYGGPADGERHQFAAHGAPVRLCVAAKLLGQRTVTQPPGSLYGTVEYAVYVLHRAVDGSGLRYVFEPMVRRGRR